MKHFFWHWSLPQPSDHNLCTYDSKQSHCQGCAVMNKYSVYEIGFCKERSVSGTLGQRLHRKDDVSAGWHDKRASNRPCNGHPPVVRSVGLAARATAATTAADDHDNDKDSRAANHSSLLHIRHVIPPWKGTWTKNIFKLIYQLCKLRFSGGTFRNFSSLI